MTEPHRAAAPQSVLIVDDEQSIRKTLAMCLEADGHRTAAAANGPDALAALDGQAFDIVFLDLRLGAANGIDLIVPMREAAPWLKIIVITAHASIESAVEAMRRGAADYVPKPFTPAQIELAVRKAAELRALEQRIDALEAQAQRDLPEGLDDSASPAMQALYAQAAQVAGSEAAVLLRGENGTGKTHLARMIHDASPRAAKPFGVVACPSLSANLLESELFGHVKGAFTGAMKDHIGRVARCEGGTLFLDEIGDMPPELQAKMLRFLQDKTYERVGDTVTRTADVRILAATNIDLEQAVAEGRFREDLFYRLNVVQLRLPPLRDRREDILPMANALLAVFARREGKNIGGFSEDAQRAIQTHRWPGNVRELRNAVERAAIFCAGATVNLQDLPESLAAPVQRIAVGDPISLDQLEEQHIRRIVALAPSLQEAADILGIDQATLWRRRKKYGID